MIATLSVLPLDMTKDFKNILIVRTDRMGDVILTTPAIETIRRNFPAAKITVLLAASTAALVEGNPFINDVMIDDRLNRHHGMAGFWRLSSEIHARRFDAAFIFHTKKRTNFLCFNARIPERIGYMDKNYGFFLTRAFPDDRPTGRKHESQYCLDLLKLAGLQVETPVMYLPVQPEARTWAEEFLRTHGLAESRRWVAIHPAASDPTKCWSSASFAQLITKLFAHEYRVVVIGHGSAIEIAQDIRRQTSTSFIDVTGQTSVAQMAGLLKSCPLLISNDSGPVHVAAAAGSYVISLFLRHQPGINPERWRPLGPKGFILTNQPHEAIELDSTGAVTSGKDDSIQVDEVLSLGLRLLQNP